MPKPLASGFSNGTAYRVLGAYSASESSEAFLILANDRAEMWFIPTRHFRVLGVFALRSDLRFRFDTPRLGQPSVAAFKGKGVSSFVRPN